MALRLDCEYRKDTLEVSLISDSMGGWTIRTGLDGQFDLFEITTMDENERFIARYANIVEAMNVASKFT